MSAFLVVKSAEGHRSTIAIPARKAKQQRDALHRAGIRRIQPALPRTALTTEDDE